MVGITTSSRQQRIGLRCLKRTVGGLFVKHHGFVTGEAVLGVGLVLNNLSDLGRVHE